MEVESDGAILDVVPVLTSSSTFANQSNCYAAGPRGARARWGSDRRRSRTSWPLARATRTVLRHVRLRPARSPRQWARSVFHPPQACSGACAAPEPTVVTQEATGLPLDVLASGKAASPGESWRSSIGAGDRSQTLFGCASHRACASRPSPARQESNLHPALRRRVLYPLSYEGATLPSVAMASSGCGLVVGGFRRGVVGAGFGRVRCVRRGPRRPGIVRQLPRRATATRPRATGRASPRA